MPGLVRPLPRPRISEAEPAGLAGCSAKIEALLEAHGQHLAFEPMDYGPLFGLASGEGSIGGLVAVGEDGEGWPLVGPDADAGAVAPGVLSDIAGRLGGHRVSVLRGGERERRAR